MATAAKLFVNIIVDGYEGYGVVKSEGVKLGVSTASRCDGGKGSGDTASTAGWCADIYPPSGALRRERSRT